MNLRFLPIALALSLFCFTPAFALEKDVAAVRDRMATFLDRQASISRSYPPFAPNAASGYLRDKIVTDKEIKNLGKAVPVPLKPAGKELWTIYKVLYNETMKSFKDNTSFYADWKNPELKDEYLKQLTNAKLEIAVLAAAIIAVVLEPNDQTVKVLKLASQKALDAVSKKAFAIKGSHGNGHISTGIVNTGVLTVKKIDAQPHSWGARKVEAVMRETCLNLTRLDTKQHRPWLTAAWQIKYEYICRSGAVALRKIK